MLLSKTAADVVTYAKILFPRPQLTLLDGGGFLNFFLVLIYVTISMFFLIIILLVSGFWTVWQK